MANWLRGSGSNFFRGWGIILYDYRGRVGLYNHKNNPLQPLWLSPLNKKISISNGPPLVFSLLENLVADIT